MIRLKDVIVLILALSILIQSVSAISNVQHSVNGNTVTLTYQGTPPYYINMQGDTNIGQVGGYLWARTYSNSFSYDMSFAINPSKRFYYGVKDTSWSDTLSFSVGEPITHDCVPLLNNGPTSLKIDLILIPDAYLTSNEMTNFVLTAKEYLGLTGTEGLFNIEPFKSNKNKFNVYYINKTISLGGCYYQSSTCDYNQIEELKSHCPSADEVVVIFNNDYYDSQYTHKAFANTCNHFATAIGHSNLEQFRPNALAHEFGHSFGCLKDVYFTQRYDYINPDWPNIDVFGCPKWCNGTPNISQPNNQGCGNLQTRQLCENTTFFPRCEWNSNLNRCLPLDIAAACSIYHDEYNCINSYGSVTHFKCKWYPPPDGYCGIEGGVFSVNNQCRQGYGCYQGAEGLAGYGAEPKRDTIMGYMTELRYDLASYDHLLNLLHNYS